MLLSKIKKLGLIAPLLAYSVFYSLNAGAACTTWGYLTGTPETVNINIPKNLIVQRDAPVGTVIWNHNFYIWPEWLNIKCDSDSYIDGSFGSGWSVAAGSTIASTNIPGVGIQFSLDGKIFSGNNTFIISTPLSNVATGYRNLAAQIKLIKTGPITAGSVKTGVYTRVALYNNFYLTNIVIADGGKIAPTSCSVKNTAINVPLNDIDRRAFSGPGSTAGEQKFTIPLNCNAQTRVKITLEATRDASGAAGVIALDSVTSGTQAGGVGIQLLSNNTPVAFSTPISVGTAASTGDYNVPLTARYYQTKSTVTPGKANSHATFTMTYN